MKLKTLTLLILLCIGTSAYSQINLDSLYAVWEDESQPHSNRVKAFNTYIWDGFLFSQPDIAFVLAEALLTFGTDNNYPIAIATSLNFIGLVYANQGDKIKALDYYMQSHGEVGKLNISQATFELIKDDSQFSIDHRGKVSAKGKGEVDMWFVSRAEK